MTKVGEHITLDIIGTKKESFLNWTTSDSFSPNNLDSLNSIHVKFNWPQSPYVKFYRLQVALNDQNESSAHSYNYLLKVDIIDSTLSTDTLMIGKFRNSLGNEDISSSDKTADSNEEVSVEASQDINNTNESARFILGKKIGMTSIYSEDGQQFPATVIEAGPCYVSQVKTDENDGYNAVQIGYVFDKKANKPKTNHFKKNDCQPMRFSREY